MLVVVGRSVGFVEVFFLGAGGVLFFLVGCFGFVFFPTSDATELIQTS